MTDPGRDPELEAEDLDGGDLDADLDHEEEGPPPTPFDHPLFLPVVLVGLALWFGYDGFINQDPDMLEHLTFNRVGFVALAIGAAWYSYQAYREMNPPEDDGPPGDS